MGSNPTAATNNIIRYEYQRREQIIKDITDNADLFRIAESTAIGGKNYLFTHAGVRAAWLQAHREELGNPESADIAERLNSMWLDIGMRPLLLPMMGDIPYSRWGNWPYGSPVWNDVDDMATDHEEVPGFVQVFGHTQQTSQPVICDYYMCLDVRCAFWFNDDGIVLV